MPYTACQLGAIQ